MADPFYEIIGKTVFVFWMIFNTVIVVVATIKLIKWIAGA